MNEVKLYEYDGGYSDSIDDLFIEHFGVKGMKWGVRKDRKKGSVNRRKKKSSKKATNKEEALKKRDLEYINNNKNQFSTKELNDLMNRINAEQRLSDMYKSSKPSAKVKKIVKSRIFKIALGVSATALVVAGATFYRDMYKGFKKPDGTFVKLLPDKQKSAFRRFYKDIGNNFVEEGYNKTRGMANQYANVDKMIDVFSDIFKK